MSLAFFPFALGIAILITFAAMIFLLLNLRAVASLLRGVGGIAPGPGKRMASRRAILIALVAFNLGWMASVAIWWTVWSGVANEAVEVETARDRAVQRSLGQHSLGW